MRGLRNLKESFLFVFSDSAWLRKYVLWLVFCLLGFTSPILVGYHLEAVRQAARGEDGRLPEFNKLWEKWKQGFTWCMVTGFLVTVPFAGMILAMIGLSEAAMLFFGSEVVFGFLAWSWVFLSIFFVPASLLRYAMTLNTESILALNSQVSDIRQGFLSYSMVAVFCPLFCFIGLVLCCFEVLASFLWPLLLPLMAFGHARLLGSYYRDHFRT